MKNRESGWYWVKAGRNREWCVIYYDHEYGGDWIGVSEKDIHEIDERRIVREEPTE